MNEVLEDDDLRMVDVLLEETLAPVATAPPRRRWLAAAAILFGLAVVVGVRMLAGGGAAEVPAVQPPHQPQQHVGDKQATVALPANAVRLRVLDSHGGPVQEFTLGLRQAFAGQPLLFGMVKQFADRRVEPRAFAGDFTVIDGLPEGDFVLQVTADRDARTRSQAFHVGGAPVADITVKLSAGGVLTGRVIDDAGKPVVGAQVSSDASNNLDPDDPMLAAFRNLLPDVVTKASARSDSGGRYRLPQLASGRYALCVDHPDYCRGTLRDLVVADEAPVEVPALALRRGAIVEGLVTATGAATEAIKVTISTPQAQVLAATQAGVNPALFSMTTTVVQGRFRFERRVPPGTYEITAYRPVPGNPLGQVAAMRQSVRELIVDAEKDRVEQDFQLK